MHAIGIDLGGTKVAAAMVSSEGEIVNKFVASTPRTADLIIESLVRIITNLMNNSGVNADDIKGIGLGVPGPVDFKEQQIIKLTNIPSVTGLKIGDEIAGKTGIRTTIDNDGILACWGEKVFGAAKNEDYVAMLTIGTGIGSGMIDKGTLIRGYRGTGAEVGHMVIKYDGPKCPCGNRGCIESLVSGPIVAYEGRRRLSLKEASVIADKQLTDNLEITAELVIEGAIKGNHICLDIVREAATYLGVAIANLLNIFNPKMILIGGGFGSAAYDLIIDDMIKEAEKRALPPNFEGVIFKRAQLGSEAGILGAAGLFF